MQASDFAPSRLADWWDEQRRESEKILGDWVEDNPQWWAVAIAGTVQTAMDLGAPMVDVLRFGEGMAEGGWKGYGKDALRALALLGPLGKAGGAASRFLTPLLRSGNLRFAYQVVGVDGPCTFQAVNNALNLSEGAQGGLKGIFTSGVKRNVFITVADMAKAVGKTVGQLQETAPNSGMYRLGAWIDNLIPFLRQIGTRIREVRGLTKISEVDNLARQETGPVIFAIKTTVQDAQGATEQILHSVIAMRSPTGMIRYADYGGKFVNSLRELVTNLGYGTPITDIELYQAGTSATVVGPAQLTGEFLSKLSQGVVIAFQGLKAIQTHENGVELAVPVQLGASPVPMIEQPVPPEVVKASFDAYKSRAKGRPVQSLPHAAKLAGKPKAPRSDWLTGVQYRLNALGFGAGPVDGIIGPLTRRAVTTFQRTYPPLRADGIPGPQTQAKLVQLCGY